MRNFDEVVQLIRDTPTVPSKIIKSREYAKELKALVKGIDFVDLLLKIDHIESKDRAEARRKYAHSIKDLNERLFRHIDNVYTATGGSKEYNLPDSFKTDILKKLSNIIGNQSLEKWLQYNWAKTIYHTDPAGLIMLEWKDEECYPTYKAISVIRNYELNGQNAMWILFEPKELTAKELKKKYGLDKIYEGKKSFWRYCDEMLDMLVMQDGTTFYQTEATYLNPFGKCPAIVVSEQTDTETGLRLSPLDGIVELEKEYLRDASIKLIYKIQHGIPQFWRVTMLCPDCNGRGKINNDVCQLCNGKGVMPRKDITDEIAIPLNSDGSIPSITKAMGWEAPPLDVWEQYNKEEVLLQDKINKTHWGSMFVEAGNETATGKFIDTQPVINRLNCYADVAEWIEWQLSEWVINFAIPTKNTAENVCSINYGRRYIIESPDEILKRYEESKAAKCPITVLDKQLTEYITSKYRNDIETLSEMLLKKDIEPYPHYEVSEVQAVFGIKEAQKKMLFNEWFNEAIIKNEAAWFKYIEEKIGIEKTTEQALAVTLGVGGTQSFQAILSDVNITPEQKKNVIKILFGLTEDQLNTLFPMNKKPMPTELAN
jgi:hypothetical protein